MKVDIMGFLSGLRSHRMDAEYFQTDVRIARWVVAVFGLFTLLFAVSDYLQFSFSSHFWTVFAVRGGMFAICVLMFLYLSFSRDKKWYSVLFFLFWLAYCAFIIYSDSFRPKETACIMIIQVSVVISMYVLIRNHLVLQIIPAVSLSVAMVVYRICGKCLVEPTSIFSIIVSMATLNGIGIFVSLRLRQQRLEKIRLKKQDARMRKKLEELAYVDPLTGLLNRRKIMELFSAEYERNRRYGSGLAILLLDLDHFKEVNDSRGHQAGDAVLKDFAQRLQRLSRICDFVGRIGGEELLVLLPETPIAGAVRFAERLIADFNTYPVKVDGQEFIVTASIGITVLNSDDSGIEATLRRADAALYRAKGEGRNRLEVQEYSS